MSRTITVGISDLNIAKAPDILVTYALGSCIGICLYDAVSKTAGLSHIMLPSAAQAPNVSDQPMKFADTAIELLIRKMEGAGVTLHVDVAVVSYIADKGYDREYGARPLKRLIQTELEDRIAEEILSRDGGKSVRVTLTNNELKFMVGS